MGESSEYFSLVDRKNKIYARRSVASKAALDFGFGVQAPDVGANIQPNVTQRTASSLATVAERKILEMYAPPGVVINEDLDIIHFRGGTGPYFEPMPGAPSFNILRLARSELHVDLRRAIHDAKESNQRTAVETRLTDDGKTRALEIEILPVIEPDTRSRCFLVLFHEPKPRREITGAPAVSSEDGSPEDERRQELERELLVTKEYLQSTIEELESANEELKSSNEELQSSNEELQSTNEELETSKEELQSSNEELTTVNDELQNRMGELQLTNDDLHNVLAGIGEAIVIVGMDLRIRRFTQSAEKLLNLVPSDVGRSVSQLNAFIRKHRVEELAARVIERLLPIEEKVLCADQRWYDLRVTPYRTLDHTIKGALIVMVAAAASGAVARPAAKAVAKAEGEGQDHAQGQAKAKAQAGEEAAMTAMKKPRKAGTVTPADVDAADTQAMLHDLDVHRLELEMQNRELREAQEQLEESRSRLADLYDFAPVAYVTLDPMGKILEANLTAAAMFGIARGNLIGKFVTTLVALADRRALRDHIRRCFGERIRVETDLSFTVRGRPPVTAQVVSAPFIAADGAVIGCKTTLTDITALKQGQEQLQLLAQAAGKLVSSFDYRTTLAEVARLAVPTLADICVVDLLNADGHIERLEVACASDAVAVRLAPYRGAPARATEASASAWVMRMRQPILLGECSPAAVATVAPGFEHDGLIRASARDVDDDRAARGARQRARRADVHRGGIGPALHRHGAGHGARSGRARGDGDRKCAPLRVGPAGDPGAPGRPHLRIARPAQPADRHSSHDGDVVAWRAAATNGARGGASSNGSGAAHSRCSA